MFCFAFLSILKQISDCISSYLYYFRLHFWKLQKLSFHKHGPLSLPNPTLEITIIPEFPFPKSNFQDSLRGVFCRARFEVQCSAQPCLTSWTVAHQAPLSMEFPRQEYWSGLPLPTPGDLPDPRMEPTSLVSPALAGKFFSTAPCGKPSWVWIRIKPGSAYSSDYYLLTLFYSRSPLHP